MKPSKSRVHATMNKKTVLLISPNFPPINNSPSKRGGCFAKYLPAYGWRVIVIAAWPDREQHSDPDYVQKMPTDVTVYRVPERIPTFRRNSTIAKIALSLWPQVFPLSWYLSAYGTLRKILRDHHVDIIWATFPFASPLTLAYGAYREFKIPWVADFRDVYEQFRAPTGVFMRRIGVFYERKQVRTAGAVTTVSPGLANILMRRHGREVNVIHNGFDPDDFIARIHAHTNKFTITYTGALIGAKKQRLATFVAALKQFASHPNVTPGDVLCDVYGCNDRAVSECVRLCDLPVGGLLRVNERVSREQCVHLQQSSTILLSLADPKMQGIMTGKIFDYLRAYRPILSVPRDNDCIDQVLRQTQAGLSLSTVNEIADQLLYWYRQWKTTGSVEYHGVPSEIEKYSRRTQAEQLAVVFDDVIKSGH